MWGFIILSSFASGWLSDRFDLRWTLTGFLVIQIVTLSGYLLSRLSFTGTILFIISFGCQAGFYGTLLTVAWRRSRCAALSR